MNKNVIPICFALLLGYGIQTAGAANYHYTAITQATAAQQGTVVAGGLSWQCKSNTCSISGPWATPGINACKSLAQRVGRISSYGHSGAKLSATQLEQCNVGITTQQLVTPPTGLHATEPTAPAVSAPVTSKQLPAITTPLSGEINQGRPQPEPPTRSGVPLSTGKTSPSTSNITPHTVTSTLPAVTPRDMTKGEPQPEPPTRQGGFGPESTRLPGPISVPGGQDGFAPAGPPRGAADTINAAIADMRTRPTIKQVLGDVTGTNCAARSFRVSGRNFGASAGTHTMMLLNPRDNSPIRVLHTYSWSDTSINIEVPEPAYGQPGHTYKVGVMDESRRLLSNVHELRLCNNKFKFSGSIRLTNCAAVTPDISVKVMRDESLLTTARAQVSSGSDFVLEYSAEINAGNSASISLVPQLRAGVCNGGEWSPPNVVHRMSYTHMNVTQDFNYRVATQEVRIDGNIVAGIITDQFGDLRIHVNTLAPGFTSPNSRYLANDTFVQMPTALGGTRTTMNLGEVVSGAFRYYLNDLNLSSLTIRAIDNQFRMRMIFESAGNEIKGFCWDGVCLPLGDDGAPDGNIDDLYIDVFFSLIRFNIGRGTGGDISIGNIEARVEAHLSGNGIAAPVIALMEDKLKEIFFPRLEGVIRDLMQTRSFKEAVARGIRSSLDSDVAAIFLGHVEDVVSVRMERGTIIVSFLPR